MGLDFIHRGKNYAVIAALSVASTMGVEQVRAAPSNPTTSARTHIAAQVRAAAGKPGPPIEDTEKIDGHEVDFRQRTQGNPSNFSADVDGNWAVSSNNEGSFSVDKTPNNTSSITGVSFINTSDKGWLIGVTRQNATAAEWHNGFKDLPADTAPAVNAIYEAVKESYKKAGVKLPPAYNDLTEFAAAHPQAAPPTTKRNQAAVTQGIKAETASSQVGAAHAPPPATRAEPPVSDMFKGFAVEKIALADPTRFYVKDNAWRIDSMSQEPINVVDLGSNRHATIGFDSYARQGKPGLSVDYHDAQGKPRVYFADDNKQGPPPEVAQFLKELDKVMSDKRLNPEGKPGAKSWEGYNELHRVAAMPPGPEQTAASHPPVRRDFRTAETAPGGMLAEFDMGKQILVAQSADWKVEFPFDDKSVIVTEAKTNKTTTFTISGTGSSKRITGAVDSDGKTWKQGEAVPDSMKSAFDTEVQGSKAAKIRADQNGVSGWVPPALDVAGKAMAAPKVKAMTAGL